MWPSATALAKRIKTFYEDMQEDGMDGQTLKGKYFTTGMQRLQSTSQSPRSGRGSPRGEDGMRATGTNFAFTARSGLTADSNVFERAMVEQEAAKEEEKVEEQPVRAVTPPQPS